MSTASVLDDHIWYIGCSYYSSHCRLQYPVGTHIPYISGSFTLYKCKNIFNKMLKDVGIEVPKSIETRSVKVQHACRQRQGMIACNNRNMRNPNLVFNLLFAIGCVHGVL